MEPLSLPLSPNLSPTSSPYITAPSSPKHPADPHSDAPDFDIQLKPFDDNHNEDDSDSQDITFEFCVDHFQSFSLPAEELFDGGKIRTLKPPPQAAQPDRAAGSPPPSARSVSQTKRKIIWSSRRSYDFSETCTEERGDKTTSFGGSKATRLNRLINILTFRRPSGRGSTSSKASTGFGSTGSSSSGSVSGWGVRYLSGSVREPGEGYGVARDEVKSCLTPCKQRLLSCFVKKL